MKQIAHKGLTKAYTPENLQFDPENRLSQKETTCIPTIHFQVLC